VAVFFIVDSSNVGWLYFYIWNSVSNFFEFKTRISVDSVAASDWQLNTSLIRTTTGVIFKAASDSNVYFYKTIDYSMTAT